LELDQVNKEQIINDIYALNPKIFEIVFETEFECTLSELRKIQNIPIAFASLLSLS